MGCGGRGSVGRATGIAGRGLSEPVSDRRARRRTALKRTAKPCGPGTRCWCQVGGGFSSPTGYRKTFNPPMTVTRRIRRRGEHDISRKTIAQGRPGVPVTCGDYTRVLPTHCTRGCGCTAHPAFPAPSDFLGRNDLQDSGASRRGIAKLRLRVRTPTTVIARESGRSSIPETLMMESKGRGVLDTPHSRSMTVAE